MNIKKKIALAAIPAVMALSATDASSKVLLMSDSGWEVSFDGAANAFHTYTSTGSMETLGFITNILLVVKLTASCYYPMVQVTPTLLMVHSKTWNQEMIFHQFTLVYYQTFGV